MLELKSSTRPGPQACRGYSLIEAMIGLAVSTFLITASVIAFSHLSSTTLDSIKTTKLFHEMRSSMALMVTDIRRIGYWGNVISNIGSATNNNPFTQSGSTDISINGDGDCVLFTYDANNDGSLPALNATGSDERFGYRLSGSVIQTRPETHSSFSCSDNDDEWHDLTDRSLVNITSLQFALGTETITLSSGTLSKRTITISMTGALASDSSVVRSLQEEVHIRNDLYTP